MCTCALLNRMTSGAVRMHLIDAEDVQADTFLFEVVANLWDAPSPDAVCNTRNRNQEPRYPKKQGPCRMTMMDRTQIGVL
mmetsp:Transcript_44070/g.71916  ORF Transcript_44070/g.71916 Transcript_44070/m.71916 type:complete len:80 (+) Transcript_44070:32-271(+)